MLIFRTSLYLATCKFDTRIVSASKKEGEKKREEKRRKAISNWSVFEPIVYYTRRYFRWKSEKRNKMRKMKKKKNSRCNRSFDDSPRLYPRWSTLTYSGRRTVNIFGANFFRKGLLALREGCELVYALLSASTCVSFELHDYWPKALSAEERIICRCSTRTVRSRCSPLH